MMKTSQKEDSGSPVRTAPKFIMLWIIFFISITYLIYTLKLISSSTSNPCKYDLLFNHNRLSLHLSSQPIKNQTTQIHNPSLTVQIGNQNTKIRHIVFGIAASAKLWEQRKEYIKLWFKRKSGMKGTVWLDKPVKTQAGDNLLPPVRISRDTSRFPYRNKQGHRSAIRISRIVSETLRLGVDKDVRWVVMGDDDTVFVTENLLRVLSKYDHNQFYYIGSSSESHLQNMYFSYGMAYGGGGFAISYPLAKALEKMQDRCIKRYPSLYGSDDRMHACMAELGVPLTKELGFHQYDVYGDLFGLLAAHPLTPLVSLHHLDVVEPIFPNMTRLEALNHLQLPMNLDSAGLMQQSICYDTERKWTITVSWGFAVQVIRGLLPPREVEMPSRTFLNWYKRADFKAYSLNTRPVSRNPCQKAFVFYLSKARLDSWTNQTVSSYRKDHRFPHPLCKWRMEHPDKLEVVEVYKKKDPELWNRSPRRNCCRILDSGRKNLAVDVHVCREGEISEL
ncbi:uncharacterized protein LOC124926901 [Impatiens glandulifera]|uniref:uncharacterized protein LOC124926901 n=1 Tax=Impatiens glandulifera TaxID=253017 RepID=UPI001FB10162|nr:uncharacterized protein LOC124926901 [Impatiens glandulifera]